jgi:type II secretory pathway pseudopilin PulG
MELGQGARPRSRVVAAFQRDRGYAMAALLVGLSIMAVLMSAALPVWSHYTKREREDELIWRGQQYARAIGLFQRKYANTFPPNVDLLVEQRFLRKKYKDPITNEDFQLIPASGVGPVSVPGPTAPGGPGRPPTPQPVVPQPVAPQPPQTQIGRPGSAPGATSGTFQPAIGIQGVVSKSSESSIKIYNGRTKYNEWMFVYLASAQRIGVAAGGQGPGQGVRPGQIQGPNGPLTPAGGADRRPGVGPGMGPGGMRGQPPLGQPPNQPPFGQPFGQPSPGQTPFGRPPTPQPPQRPPGG